MRLSYCLDEIYLFEIQKGTNLRMGRWLYSTVTINLTNHAFKVRVSKANTTDIEPPSLDLHISIANGFVSSKTYDKRDDFDVDIVNIPFWDGDVPRHASYGVYFSQLMRFASIDVRNKCLTAKFLQQGYQYHKLRKCFLNFIADTMSCFPNLMLG